MIECFKVTVNKKKGSRLWQCMCIKRNRKSDDWRNVSIHLMPRHHRQLLSVEQKMTKFFQNILISSKIVLHCSRDRFPHPWKVWQIYQRNVLYSTHTSQQQSNVLYQRNIDMKNNNFINFFSSKIPIISLILNYIYIYTNANFLNSVDYTFLLRSLLLAYCLNEVTFCCTVLLSDKILNAWRKIRKFAELTRRCTMSMSGVFQFRYACWMKHFLLRLLSDFSFDLTAYRKPGSNSNWGNVVVFVHREHPHDIRTYFFKFPHE